MSLFLRDPSEEALAELIAEYGTLRGLRDEDTGHFYVWPAEQNWHVEMADHLERIGEIAPDANLARLVISSAEDAWFLYRDAP